MKIAAQDVKGFDGVGAVRSSMHSANGAL